MRCILFFKYYAFALVKRILRLSKRNFFYNTKYGMKIISPKKDYSLNYCNSSDLLLIDPVNLYLGIDGLFDEYTLVGKNIFDSPHYNLIVCSEKKDLKNCEYIWREERGCLDSRDFKYVPLKRHLMEYNRIKNEMLLNKTKPILFYKVNGKMYLKDGKHRAALYAFMGKKIPAKEIDAKFFAPLSVYQKELYKRLDDVRFSRHRDLLVGLFEKNGD
jgi:hypothetical protein